MQSVGSTEHAPQTRMPGSDRGRGPPPEGKPRGRSQWNIRAPFPNAALLWGLSLMLRDPGQQNKCWPMGWCWRPTSGCPQGRNGGDSQGTEAAGKTLEGAWPTEQHWQVPEQLGAQVWCLALTVNPELQATFAGRGSLFSEVRGLGRQACDLAVTHQLFSRACTRGGGGWRLSRRPGQ